MYEIIRCLGCNRLYKDTAGFSQIGGKRGSLRFYSDSDDAGHPGSAHHFVLVYPEFMMIRWRTWSSQV